MFEGKANRKIRGMHPLIISCIELEGNRMERRADERVTRERSNQNHTHNNF